MIGIGEIGIADHDRIGTVLCAFCLQGEPEFRITVGLETFRKNTQELSLTMRKKRSGTHPEISNVSSFSKRDSGIPNSR